MPDVIILFRLKINIMTNPLIDTIISNEDTIRNRSITSLLKGMPLKTLLEHAVVLEQFRQTTKNLYHRVRACLFLFVIYRLYLQEHPEIRLLGEIPFNGVRYALIENLKKLLKYTLTG